MQSYLSTSIYFFLAGGALVMSPMIHWPFDTNEEKERIGHFLKATLGLAHGSPCTSRMKYVALNSERLNVVP